MGSYSRQMFPRRRDLVNYLNQFASKSRLSIVYNSDVSNITRITDDVIDDVTASSSGSSSGDSDARFTMIDQRRQVYNCR